MSRELNDSSSQILRGEIYYIYDGNNAHGCEQQGGRPGIVVSNNINNRHSTTVEVVYCTTRQKRELPTHVMISSLRRPSTALCEQVTTVSVSRLGRYVGRCTYVHVKSKDNTDETKHAIALELDEVAALLGSTREAHRERDLCILVMFLTTGMRLNELVNLNVCDIKFGEDMLINIRRGKGSKTRVIPMNVQCANQVKRYLTIRQKQVDEQNLNELPNGNNPLFLSQENHRISRRRVQSIVERAITAAGLGGKNYSTHKLRHTAATLLYNNGADLNLLKSILGHNTIQTTTIYAHPDIEARRAAIDLNPIAKIDLGALETINAARKLFPLEEEDGNQTSKEGD